MIGDTESLQREYQLLSSLANEFSRELTSQIRSLLDKESIALAVPIECRVKSWESIADKLSRKRLELDSLKQLTDLVGLRLILLFQRDVAGASEAISRAFDVQEREDTSGRLGDDQFGYQSTHFIIKIPKHWLGVPTLSLFADFLAEIQVRTAAQHIWATASHVLQYKQEASVPPQLRRSIYRVSALLETVDLEFERLLATRREYKEGITHPDKDSALDTDILESLLDNILRSKNKSPDEPYSQLIADLTAFNLQTVDDVQALLSKHKEEMLAEDAMRVSQESGKEKPTGTSKERIQRGVFYTHTGLLRTALGLEFGDKWTEYSRGISYQ